MSYSHQFYHYLFLLSKVDHLEIFYDEMREHISPTILNEGIGTHVVVGIGWGANVIAAFEDQSVDTSGVFAAQTRMRAVAKTKNLAITSQFS